MNVFLFILYMSFRFRLKECIDLTNVFLQTILMKTFRSVGGGGAFFLTFGAIHLNTSLRILLYYYYRRRIPYLPYISRRRVYTYIIILYRDT